jgi:hypothetical protein
VKFSKSKTWISIVPQAISVTLASNESDFITPGATKLIRISDIYRDTSTFQILWKGVLIVSFFILPILNANLQSFIIILQLGIEVETFFDAHANARKTD